MSLYPKQKLQKRCFVACPPHLCDCIAGSIDLNMQMPDLTHNPGNFDIPVGDFNYDVQYPCDVEPPHEVSEEDPHDQSTTDDTSSKTR